MAMSTNEKTRYKNDFNKENYQRVVLYLRPEMKARWKEAADRKSMSMNEYIKRCVNKEIKGDG